MVHRLELRRTLLGVAVVATVAILVALISMALNARAVTEDDDGVPNDPEIIPAEAEIFAEGNEFPDDFRAEYRIKFDQQDTTTRSRTGKVPQRNEARETFERLVNDGSNVFIGSLTFPEGEDGAVGGVDWHTHPGPFLVAVTEGELTVTWEDECEARAYESGEAFVDLGQRVHKAENFADEETVVYFAVIGVPEGEPITNVVADDEGFEQPC